MDLMIDLETLGTKPGSIILSIGACVFDPKTGECPSQGMFYERLNQDSQVILHMTADADTVEWWSNQSPEAQAILSTDQQSTALPIWEALAKLDRFVEQARMNLPDDCGGEFGAVWAQGQDFDFGILGEAYRRAREGTDNTQMPWPFWSHSDTRTVYREYGFDTSTVERTGVHHRALDDCIHQVKCLLLARSHGNVKIAELLEQFHYREDSWDHEAINAIARHFNLTEPFTR